MKIQNFVVFTIFILSAGAYAASGPQNFTSKERCYDHFFKKNDTRDEVAAEDFCKDKYVKSSDDTCAEAKLLDYKKKNSISSVEEPKFLRKYKNECTQARNDNRHNLQISAQSAQQGSQAQQWNNNINARNNKIKADVAAKQKQEDTAKDIGTTVAILAASKPIIKDATSAYNGAEAAAATTATTGAAARAASGTNAATATQTTAPASAGSVPVVAPAAPAVVTSSATPAAAPAAVPVQGATGNGNFSSGTPGGDPPGDFNNANQSLTKSTPELTDKVKATDTASNVSTATPSTITTAAEAASANLVASVNSAVTTANGVLTIGTPPFSTTAAAYTDFANLVAKYVAAKKRCTTLTENTEMLCLDGKSPTVAALKVLVNSAGPLLIAVGSAQKACSKTADVTRYVSAGLVVAKGLCVASQTACYFFCPSIAKTLESDATAAVTKIDGAFNTEYTAAKIGCYAGDVETLGACTAQVEAKATANTAGLTALKAAVAAETAPTPGTANGLAYSCKMKVTDIALFATNIAGLVMAQKSAEACAESLAASGAAGAAVTSTQFCEVPANVNIQFCKCQKNSNQVGCPGYQANSNNEVTKDTVGTNLKSNGGLNGFASSAKTAVGLPKNSALDGKINSAEEASQSKSSGAAAGEPLNSAGPGDANKSAKAGDAGNSAAKAALDAAEKEKKKWSFGAAFANSVSSMFGGRNSKTPGSNGNMKLKQDEAAIQRKIASDRLADEITAASGKSNWEKVHQVYSIKENTLMRGQ